MNLDTPVNIHLTGCHNSCAQHHISDIGLLACKIEISENSDPVEGYHIFAGGGFGPGARIGCELFRNVKAEDVPQTIKRMLNAYLVHRSGPGETFLEFAARHDAEELRTLFAKGTAA